MTYITKPKFHHPALPKNALGYTHRDYEGSVSTPVSYTHLTLPTIYSV